MRERPQDAPQCQRMRTGHLGERGRGRWPVCEPIWEAEALVPVLLCIREQLGASLVLIKHDMPLVTSVADRLVALDQGRLVAEGPPDEVLAHPQVIASYLGPNEAVIARSGTRAAGPG